MISDSWNKTGDTISQKVMNRVKPDEPLKNKIDIAQKKLQFQISKLESINQSLQKKHDFIFEKIVNAQRCRKISYAHAYANELAQVRKMKNMVSGAKLSMEQIKIRLDTVSELGDVVVTLNPCMSIIRGLSPQLSGMMPEANASMQDLSQLLGDVVSGSSVDVGVGLAAGNAPTADTMAILDEAHGIIAGQAKTSIPDVPAEIIGKSKSTYSGRTETSIPDVPAEIIGKSKSTYSGRTEISIPDVPDSLKHQIVQKKRGVFI